jgi:hypothetical protein
LPAAAALLVVFGRAASLVAAFFAFESCNYCSPISSYNPERDYILIQALKSDMLKIHKERKLNMV